MVRPEAYRNATKLRYDGHPVIGIGIEVGRERAGSAGQVLLDWYEETVVILSS